MGMGGENIASPNAELEAGQMRHVDFLCADSGRFATAKQMTVD